MLTLVIGNKNYSSWSMRPWVLLKHFGIEFTEQMILLDQADTAQKILDISPAGRVPVLMDDDLLIWDTLAISEYLVEKFPQLNLLPKDRKLRAQARSVCAEMHAGFSALRTECTMNIRRKRVLRNLSSAAQADVARINALWEHALALSGGPFLFGEFSVADAFYAPVATRFQTYDLQRSQVSNAYIERLLAAPGVVDWINAAQEEKIFIEKYDV